MKRYSSVFKTGKGKVLTILIVLCGFSQETTFNQADFEKLESLLSNLINKRQRGDIYESWNRIGEKSLPG